MDKLQMQQCEPCRGDEPALTHDEIESFLEQVRKRKIPNPV